ncbi:Polyketide cyclase / dehydrase and lipid transport [Meinhardsimonia xiamenensis]|jgi:uncharacterized protein YndB with AHSA1/START domain|uniref:Polyketide cyclase / dehydrase and lipid transport n=1 Tax=Meinhardsimonia xiamenensis TaxID=990712 RepID=A0A1G9CFD2_9RHOB|nr:SRPBCC family protein [Meinhardsimonia xiamenensis]PRX38381.1 polyketide cyclase/dehydrase/lipid transport protein [Meinhardsimonia xiamenensis]SDK50347.1 Polyketide cyclase / dehydrase and lipid transport [Meinhardsimonia xiamenensis]
MKISTRRDIEAPIEVVFAAVTDFEGFERQALRRGAEVRREDPDGSPGLGSRWTIRGRFRGRPRELEATLSRYEPPEAMAFDIRAAGIEGRLEIELVALSARRTRLRLALELRPNTFKGRLLLHSLKLAKGAAKSRIDGRLEQFARRLEETGTPLS